MAKKKTSDGSAKGPRLRKEIAGVKLGKDLRNAIDPVMRFAHHPMVSETLAAALLAGAAALAGKKGGSSAKAGGGDAKDAAEAAENRLGLALAVAAGEIASRIVASYDPGGDAKASKAVKPGAKAKAKTGTKAKPKAAKLR